MSISQLDRRRKKGVPPRVDKPERSDKLYRTVDGVDLKTCSHCRVEMPATSDNFYKSKSGKFGKTARCKSCVSLFTNGNPTHSIDFYQETYGKTKICTQCQSELPVSFDHFRPKGKYLNGSCNECWRKRNRKNDARGRKQPCSVDGCFKNSKNGYPRMCSFHYRRFKLYGDPHAKMPRDVLWDRVKQEGKLTGGGYRLVYRPEHPEAYPDTERNRANCSCGWALEHRVVMSDHLGRKLYDGENVHHKNGIRTDNRLSNLELWVTSQPSGQRVEDLVKFARKILELYGDVNVNSQTHKKMDRSERAHGAGRLSDSRQDQPQVCSVRGA